MEKFVRLASNCELTWWQWCYNFVDIIDCGRSFSGISSYLVNINK